jgi:hypothetical protein
LGYNEVMKNMCQSCGQPLRDTNKGTEQDGRPSVEYCSLCYDAGAFKDPNLTLDDMKAIYVEAMRQMHFPRFIGKMMANSQLPKLGRWSA